MPKTYTQLYFHIVFATKHRHPWLKGDFRTDLYAVIGETIRTQGGTPIAIGGMEDHVHVLTGLGTTRALAMVVKAIKGASSHWINASERCPDHFGWQEGYSIFTVSRSLLPVARRYVQNQEHHHRRRSFQEEMVVLHRAHGLEYRTEADPSRGSEGSDTLRPADV